MACIQTTNIALMCDNMPFLLSWKIAK